MYDRFARSVIFGDLQNNANQQPTVGNYYIFLAAKCVMSLIGMTVYIKLHMPVTVTARGL